ncbi:hypothetical protein ACI78Q_00255 [Geodermatophilus sp. SYSU D00705]
MGRVRLTAGGVSPGQVRLKPSGASERLRRPADDIDYTTRPGQRCRICRRNVPQRPVCRPAGALAVGARGPGGEHGLRAQ